MLLQVHGGAWTLGEKEHQGRPLMNQMAAKGWVCVAINYRLSPRDPWPAHIVDVKRAIAWVRDNIADYGGDPDYLVITGGSAGGHLAALAALTPGDPAVPARLRGRRHQRAGGGAVLRRLRLRRARPGWPTPSACATPSSAPGSCRRRGRTRPRSTRPPPRSCASPPTHRTSSSSTASSTASSPSTRRGCSSPSCGARRRSPWCTPSCRAPSTPSTSSTPSAAPTRSGPSTATSPGTGTPGATASRPTAASSPRDRGARRAPPS